MVDAKTTWGAGEYALMAAALEPVSTRVIETAGVSLGDRVIDVATGTGNAALLAAARGASVLGVDLEPALLALAHDRGRAAGVEIDWLEGNAQVLPAADRQADVVVSVFGVMYALDHARAASELVRVLAPVGRIALAAWTPGSFMPAMGAVLADYLPPAPASSGPPTHWGQSETLELLMRNAGARMKTATTEQLRLHFRDTKDAVDFLIRTAGHIISQRQRLTETARWAALQHDLELFVTQEGSQHANGFDLELEYMIANATID